MEAGYHPIEMKRGLNFAAARFIDFLESCTKPVTRKEELYNLAMITTNNHEDISMIISEALITLGINGIINVEDSNIGLNQLIVRKEII
jgi:chaperonin GroEL